LIFPFQKGQDYTFRLLIDQCETSIIVASFIAYTSNSNYAKNWNTVNGKNDAQEIEYINKIFSASWTINTKCREILTKGFFHVYGMQTQDLETLMVNQIGDIEKSMMNFKTS